jgi:hypothetical protein
MRWRWCFVIDQGWRGIAFRGPVAATQREQPGRQASAEVADDCGGEHDPGERHVKRKNGDEGSPRD